MAGLRKFSCYQRIKRAYTRKSKFKKKGYIKAPPQVKIVRYDMGDSTKTYQYEVDLISRDNIQIRQNAIESARMVVNRLLHKKLGTNYYLKIRLYPHHVLRENKMLVGAGADRMQSGMQKAFGKAIGVAAQVKKGKILFAAKINKEGIEIAKEALKKAGPRLPGRCSIEVKEIKK